MHPSTERALSPYARTKKAGMPVIPVYDNGGEVTEAQRLAITPIVLPKNLTEDTLRTAPVYDEGGDVDVNDGHHQAAILEEGERVLTPEQNEQYKAEHPELITSNTKTPAPTAKEQAAQIVSNPGAHTVTSEPTEQLIPERDTTKDEQPTQGTALGKAWLKRIGVPAEAPTTTSDVAGPIAERPTAGMPTIKTPASSVVSPETLALIPGTPENRAAKMPIYGGPGKPVAQGELIPTKQLPQDELKYQLADLKQQHSAALAERTPEGQEKADRIAEQIRDLQKNNPWGSEANRPGVLGKIGHYASRVGNIAGDILAPGLLAPIPGSDVNNRIKQIQLANATDKDTQLATQRTAEEDKSAGVGVGKTTQELTFHDLMTGDNGKPRINPDTQKPYTTQEANVASQGTGKSSDELYIQDQMRQVNPDTEKPFTRREATENLLQLKAGNRPVSRQEQALKDYMQAQGLADTPANRDAARIAVARRDVQTKALAALPIQEQRSTFDNNLRQESALLEQTHADALQRGKSADEVQQKENARHEAVISKIQTAQDTVKSADESEFAAAIAPVTTLLAVTSAEGVKRVNRDELARFVPQNGDLWRWATTHTDQWLAGEIPDKYRDEVGKMLSKMEAQEDREHLANTHSVDATIRQGAQTPGKGNKSESSKNSAGPTKGDEQTHNGFVYVFDGTHYVKDHAVGK